MTHVGPEPATASTPREPVSPLLRAGITVATGVATFVPLPFVGEWLIGRSRRQLAAALLVRHARTLPSADLIPYAHEGWGSVLGWPLRFVKGLVLRPIKKMLHTVFIVLAIRDVALEMGKTLALAHILDRMLASGSFRDDDTSAHRRHEAKRLREAVDAAYAGIDERLVRSAIAAIRHAARRRMNRDGADDDADDRRAMASFLTELERRVDMALLGHSLDGTVTPPLVTTPPAR